MKTKEELLHTLQRAKKLLVVLGGQGYLFVYESGKFAEHRKKFWHLLRQGGEVRLKGNAIWLDYEPVWVGSQIGEYIWDKTGNKVKVQELLVVKQKDSTIKKYKRRIIWLDYLDKRIS